MYMCIYQEIRSNRGWEGSAGQEKLPQRSNDSANLKEENLIKQGGNGFLKD